MAPSDPGVSGAAAAVRGGGRLELTYRRLAELGLPGQAAVDVRTALITGMTSQQIADDPGGDRWRRLLPDVRGPDHRGSLATPGPPSRAFGREATPLSGWYRASLPCQCVRRRPPGARRWCRR